LEGYGSNLEPSNRAALSYFSLTTSYYTQGRKRHFVSSRITEEARALEKVLKIYFVVE
jgi:hypothetical protein